jgi:predicted ATPase/DNA-binding XRE family transcriptional regulator
MDGVQSFGQWLRHRRRELDLTQDALARQAGCARVTIRKLEADEIRPSRQLAELLAEHLGIPPQERETFVRLGRGGSPASPSPLGPRHNLPYSPSSFVGRERELAAVRQLLSGSRLVTLTGAGGIGKTRLALQVARELAPTMADGAWLVELAPLSEPALVPLAVAKVLDVREEPGRPLADTLAEALAGKQLLLVLDNCDHLLAASAQLADVLLRQQQRLRLLATSRERLNLRGEVVWPVSALSLPVGPSGATATAEGPVTSEAVRLFVERAAAVLPGFGLTQENAAPVAEICARLDGMPLAIELAAARVGTLSVNQIAARLDDAFRLLTRGSHDSPPRQQTLRATMDWSYALVAEPERVLFRRLAVFAGSFSLDAAESMAGGDWQAPPDAAPATAYPGLAPSDVLDLLSSLVDKSLITVLGWQSAGQARYRLLEPVRQYAQEKLVQVGEAEALRAQHLAYFLRLAEQAAPKMEGAEQAAWLDRLEAELDNIRVAIDWALQHGEVQAALQIMAFLRRLWFIRPHHGEGVERLRRLLARPDAAAPTRARLAALNTCFMMLWPQGDLNTVQPLVDEALALAGALEDRWNRAFALMWVGDSAGMRGNYELACSYLEQSLALWQELGDRLYRGWTLTLLGDVTLVRGDASRAQSLFETSIPLLWEATDNSMLAVPLRRLGQLALARGDYAGARDGIHESLLSNWKVRDHRGTAACLAALAALCMAQGDLGEAASLLGCVASFLEFIHTRLLLYDQQQYEHNLAALRAQMGAAAFEAAAAHGRALTRQQAVELALALIAPDTP